MEVDLGDRNAVRVALSRGDSPIDRRRLLPHTHRNRQRVQDLGNLMQAAVGMMVMVVIIGGIVVVVGIVMVVVLRVVTVVVVVLRVVMVVVAGCFFFPVDRYGHMGAEDPALFGGLGAEGDPGDTKSVELGEDCFLFRHQLVKRRAQHIPRSAHCAVQIQNLHGFASI